MVAHLQYLLITVKVVTSVKVPFSDTQFLRLFVNTLTVNDKYYVFNRDNLPQPIKMQLAQKHKTSAYFFFCNFKIYIKF